MKVLHTSDWHLGQQLHQRSRAEEHHRALQWLIQLIETERVDLLLISGDVFDLTNPPNYARKLYHDFLNSVTESGCRVVITAGNHDSPTMLDATSSLLQRIGVTVVSHGTEHIYEQIVPVKDPQGNLLAVVAAVPFLRDTLLLPPIAGESPEDRVTRRRANLKAHYEQIAQAIRQYAAHQVPLIGMGHLYVQHCDDPEGQDNIYLGDKANIRVEDFPEVFDYVALGHIHRAQTLDTQGRIRYAGSLIPLNFSEQPDDKSVWLLKFEGRQLKNISAYPVPTYRRLKIIYSQANELHTQLKTFAERHTNELKPWVWVKLTDNQPLHHPVRLVMEAAKELRLEIVSTTVEPHASLHPTSQPFAQDLKMLAPEEVFNFILAYHNFDEPTKQQLRQTFRELLELVQQREKA